jgi:hypothetical protein
VEATPGKRTVLRRLGGIGPRATDGQGAETELDDWLGDRKLDWTGDLRDGETSRGSDQLWPGADPDAEPQRIRERPVDIAPPHDDVIRRRRTVAILAIFAVILAVIVPIAVFAGGGNETAQEPITPAPGTSTTPATTPDEPSTTPAPEPETPTAALLKLTLPDGGSLRRGDRGATVETLQKALAALGHDPGEVDGAFGAKTAAAVVAFQQANDLEADGIVGPKTVTKLNAVLAERDVRQ